MSRPWHVILNDWQDTIYEDRGAFEDDYFERVLEMHQGMKEHMGAALEVLGQLVTDGPVEDGDVISKQARDELLELGLAHKCVFKSEQGYQVASYLGYSVYFAEAVHARNSGRLTASTGVERSRAITQQELRDLAARYWEVQAELLASYKVITADALRWAIKVTRP